MSAAAAPRRVDPGLQRVLTAAEKKKWARYIQLPLFLMDRLFECGVPRTVIAVVFKIMRETYGGIPRGGRRPQWADVTEEQFAKYANVGITGARKAIEEALTDWKLIEAEKVGRMFRYRLLVSSLFDMASRDKRSVDKAEKIAPRDRSSFQVSPGARKMLEFSNPLKNIDIAAVSGSFHISSEQREDSLVLTVSPAKGKGEDKENNTDTPVTVSIAQLDSFLEDIFIREFGYPPFPEQLESIAARLPSGAMKDFENVVNSRLRRKGPTVQPGLFVNLAEDAAHAYNKRAAKKALEPTTASAPSFLCEPEGSASEWARLLVYLKTQVGPIPFSSWFESTRQVSVERDILRVATPFQAAASYLNEEYGPQITAAIEALGLDFVAVEFFPEGD